MSKLPQLKDQNLWLCALTHRSYVNENANATEHNERLEFLGDAILGFIIAEWLFQRYSHLSEAQLTRLRAKLIDETQLAQLARQLDLGQQMRLGKGAEKDRGRENPALLSDTFEAIIGAYYLDAGIEAVQAYVRSLFHSAIENLVVSSSLQVSPSVVDIKNRLQQWSLSKFEQIPQYFLIKETGLDHAKEFTFGVKIKDYIYGIGSGRRKQEATKNAAEDAYNLIYAEIPPEILTLKLDAQQQLQQWSTSEYQKNPEYFTIKSPKNHHTPQFTVGVHIDGQVCGIGQGHSESEAITTAAKAALYQLRILTE